jgi:hypothetical protein
MSFRSKDDFGDSKSNLIFLDLSDLLLLTKEELDKTLSRLPDLKLKSDILEEASNKKPYFPHSKSNILYTHKQSLKHLVSNSCLSKSSISTQICSSIPDSRISIPDSRISYINPLPQSMSHLNLNDFCGTEIDWKMLTLSRPSTKLEEDYMSKLVELYQFRHKTRIEDGYGFRKAVFRLSRHPPVMQYKPVSLMFDLKSSENTKRILIKEDTTYEAYARVAIETAPNHYSDQTLAAELLSSGNSLDFKLFSDQNL